MAKKLSFPTLEEMKTERDALLINKTNPERLKYLQSQIDYLEYGIKT